MYVPGNEIILQNRRLVDAPSMQTSFTYKTRELKYYVENKAQLETWK